MTMTHDQGTITKAFLQAMEEVGISTTDEIIPDGSLHRFHVTGHRAGTKNGAYVLHTDGVPSGWFNDFVTGAVHKWTIKGGVDWSLSPDQLAAIDKAKLERQAEMERRKLRAEGKARSLWKRASPCICHPYLERKKVRSFGLRCTSWEKFVQDLDGEWRSIQIENVLLVPLHDKDGAMKNLQAIFPQKHEELGRDKDFLAGGKKKGLFFGIGQETETILIAEGYATAATVHEATGYLTFVAFDAGNLHPVAQLLRSRFPQHRIVLCADNDQFTENNPGLSKAKEAAVSIGGAVAIPEFKNLSQKPTDFNDMLMEGHDTREAHAKIREIIERAVVQFEPKKPTIRIKPGSLPSIVDQAEQAILENGSQIYQRGSVLVRPARTTAATVKAMGLERDAGALTLKIIEQPWLLEELTRAACWERFDRRSKSWVPADAPSNVALTYLARLGSWKVPTLVATIQTPTLRPDGTVLDKPGYDSKTGLLFDPGGVDFLPVPNHPTLEHARESLAVLLDLLKGFPFSEPHDTSVALSAILTSLIRRSIKSAPLHAFSAPKMASGKSLLADVVAMIATGKTAAVIPYVEDSNEERKRILAALIGGDAMICVDNIEKPWGSDCLCSVLTQEFYQDRLLGVSKNIIVPTCTTWLATGNNITFVGDLTTRVLPCFLDPQTDKPEERKFEVNLYDLVPEQRAVFVQAALTILRGYQVAGRPDIGLKPFGRFEQWSDWVRSALVWVGCADPCLSRELIEAADPVRQDLSILLEAWYAVFGQTPVTVSDISKQIEGDPEDQAAIALKECIEEIAGIKGKGFNRHRFGNWFQKYKMRIEGGKRLEPAGNRGHCATWRLVEVGSRSSDTYQPNVSLVSLRSLYRPPTEKSQSCFNFNGDGAKIPDPLGQNSSNSPNSIPVDLVDQLEEWEV